jgi:hypothetical protein
LKLLDETVSTESELGMALQYILQQSNEHDNQYLKNGL